ncbi:MAG: glycosyltransferase family 4 protein [Thermoplasmata archaeon]
MAWRLCVNSQTPPIRFLISAEESIKRFGNAPVSISSLVEGKDYIPSPGGVTRMVYPLLQHMRKENLIREPQWVALNPNGPEEVILDGGIVLHNVRLKKEVLSSYGRFKEAIWRIVHGLKLSTVTTEDFANYVRYNHQCVKKINELQKEEKFDVVFIQDFQQLMVGAEIKGIPKLMRWHIPLNFEEMPIRWRIFLGNALNKFDAIIVTCNKYAESLRRLGFRGKVFQSYPYIDESTFKVPSKETLQAFADKYGIDDDDFLILSVGRMDPIKGQDDIIYSMKKLIMMENGRKTSRNEISTGLSNEHEQTKNDLRMKEKRYKKGKFKALLIGNGSFSSSKGGIGLSKGEQWRAYLDKLRIELKVTDRVTIAGHVSEDELNAAYKRADVVVLPSTKEGFGLTVIEAWLYYTPVIVSEGSGVSELVKEGENGFVYKHGDIERLTEKIYYLSNKPDICIKMGKAGRITARICDVKNGIRETERILNEIINLSSVKNKK